MPVPHKYRSAAIQAGALIIAALLEAGGTRAIADSGTVRQARSVASFDKVESGGALQLTIDAGAPKQSVVVEAPPDVIGKITTEVRDGTLQISEKNVTNPSFTPRVTIGVPALSALSSGGADTITVKNLHGPAFAVDLSGAGNIKVAGQTGSLTATLSGAANIDATGLKSRSATVSITGAGSAKVWAHDTLSANITGAGSITYFGKPAHVNQRILGVGSIDPG